MKDLWLFDAIGLVWDFLTGDRHRPNRAERKLKAHHLRRVAEIKAERGQF